MCAEDSGLFEVTCEEDAIVGKSKGGGGVIVFAATGFFGPEELSLWVEAGHKDIDVVGGLERGALDLDIGAKTAE